MAVSSDKVWESNRSKTKTKRHPKKLLKKEAKKINDPELANPSSGAALGNSTNTPESSLRQSPQGGGLKSAPKSPSGQNRHSYVATLVDKPFDELVGSTKSNGMDTAHLHCAIKKKLT